MQDIRFTLPGSSEQQILMSVPRNLRHKPRHKGRLGYLDLCRKLLIQLVGAARFELTTPCAQGRCATRLRYAPTSTGLFILNHFRTSRYCPVYPIEAKRAPTVAKP